MSSLLRNLQQNIRLQIGLVFVVCLGSAISLFVTCWPGPVLEEKIVLQPDRVAKLTQAQNILTLLENRVLILKWPETMWAADEAEIVLRIVQEGSPNQAATSDGNVVAVARLEMPEADAFVGERRQPLVPGQQVEFRWNIRTRPAESTSGVVWLHLESVPQDRGEIESVLLLARPVETKTVSFMGLPAAAARFSSVVGLVISFFFATSLLRRKKRRGKTHVKQIV